MIPTPVVTICIPFAKYHSKLVERAVDSAYRQTVNCVVNIREDHYGYGAGDNRNALLAKVRTPFVVFLDADDTLDSRFVEACLRVMGKGNYVYTDWAEDGVYQRAPVCDEWIGSKERKRMHLVTTLLVTEHARKVGGFDAALPGAEDTDFYLKLRVAGICPIHVKAALLNYSGDGRRSREWLANPIQPAVIAQMWELYGGRIMACGCSSVAGNAPAGGKQEGDVIARALYAPSKEFGLNGRFYPRLTHQGALMWVARQDIDHWPTKWEMVDDPDNIAPDVDKVAALALAGLGEMV